MLAFQKQLVPKMEPIITTVTKVVTLVAEVKGVEV